MQAYEALRIAARPPALRAGYRPPDDPARGGLDRVGRAPEQGLLPGPGDRGPGAQPRPSAAPAGLPAPGRQRGPAARRTATRSELGEATSRVRRARPRGITSWARSALALIKRTTPVDVTLLAAGLPAAQEVIVPPDAGANVKVTLKRRPGLVRLAPSGWARLVPANYWRSSRCCGARCWPPRAVTESRHLITSAPLTRDVVARYVAGDTTAEAVRVSRELLQRGPAGQPGLPGRGHHRPGAGRRGHRRVRARCWPSWPRAGWPPGAGRRSRSSPPRSAWAWPSTGRRPPPRTSPGSAPRPGGRHHGDRGHGGPHPGGPDAADRPGDPARPPGPGRGHPVLAAPLGGGLRRAGAGRAPGSGCARARTTRQARWPSRRATRWTAVTPARCGC